MIDLERLRNFLTKVNEVIVNKDLVEDVVLIDIIDDLELDISSFKLYIEKLKLKTHRQNESFLGQDDTVRLILDNVMDSTGTPHTVYETNQTLFVDKSKEFATNFRSIDHKNVPESLSKVIRERARGVQFDGTRRSAINICDWLMNVFDDIILEVSASTDQNIKVYNQVDKTTEDPVVIKIYFSEYDNFKIASMDNWVIINHEGGLEILSNEDFGLEGYTR